MDTRKNKDYHGCQVEIHSQLHKLVLHDTGKPIFPGKLDLSPNKPSLKIMDIHWGKA
jgi:hypothetical protein